MPGRRYGFGECYFECNKDQAEELLDKQKEDTMKEIAVLNGELNSIHETLAPLKTQLCARSYSEPPTHSRHDTTLSPCTLRPRRTSTLLAVHTSACAVLADMAASATTSTWRRTPRALELERPGNGALIKSV